MRLRIIALTVCAFTLGSAPSWAADGPSKAAKAPTTTKRALFAEKITKMRPKGWSVDRGKKPSGVAAALLGPRTNQGRAVVSLRPWTRAPELPASAQGRAALAEVLGVPGEALKISSGPNGVTIADLAVRKGVQVRYIIHTQGLLTLGAPPALLPKVSAWVMKALARLP